MLALFALVVPNMLTRLTPSAFVRIPVEGILAAALLLVLPVMARRVVAVLTGVALGLLTILKFLDMGFYSVLNRPFDLMLVEQIENRALSGVERDDLDRFAIVHFADVDVVVEVERARRLRRDFPVLEAGLRKHQRL